MDTPARNPRLPAALGWAALEAMSSAAAIKDDSLRYVWANAAFHALFRTTPGLVVGQSDDEVFAAGPLIPDRSGDHQVLLSGAPDERYETLSFADGTMREVLVATSRVMVDADIFLLSVVHDISEIAAANHSLVTTTEDLVAESDEFRSQAMHDPLTEVFNLRGFEAHALAALDRSPTAGALLMLDLDDFKAINDQHGHEAGDAVLCMLADVLRECTRRKRDVIARLGGDEFAVAMPELAEPEARAVAERIRSTIEHRPVAVGDTRIVPEVSIGIALRDQDKSVAIVEWRRRADEALYGAKRAGKGQAVLALL